jgi:hypothetical protein
MINILTIFSIQKQIYKKNSVFFSKSCCSNAISYTISFLGWSIVDVRYNVAHIRVTLLLGKEKVFKKKMHQGKVIEKKIYQVKAIKTKQNARFLLLYLLP